MSDTNVTPATTILCTKLDKPVTRDLHLDCKLLIQPEYVSVHGVPFAILISSPRKLTSMLGRNPELFIAINRRAGLILAPVVDFAEDSELQKSVEVHA
ncbi:hypothetical protein PAXINDRAFT_21639 [Paxillus involutus ATCC 200175]|uniref:Uncharacterized protein n=1 Tax=Paxillus involutus ATCC 200175 TaxID=664439 RepID=A0A0C9SLV3_PAXIN|nr:hypothetical protein PAXINDRAFT_21639 [Paxillus involutus ATCC 200175]